MSRPKLLTQIKEVEGRIRAHGFALRYVEWCEDAQTPGFLGQIRGVTDPVGKTVKISLRANPLRCDMLDILKHELRHIEDPAWDCGSRHIGSKWGERR